MKLCNICKVIKIKNNYTVCYDCNQKSDSASENETVPAYKKESIPKTIKNCLWINYFKDSRIGVCQCCKRETITWGNLGLEGSARNKRNQNSLSCDHGSHACRWPHEIHTSQTWTNASSLKWGGHASSI